MFLYLGVYKKIAFRKGFQVELRQHQDHLMPALNNKTNWLSSHQSTKSLGMRVALNVWHGTARIVQQGLGVYWKSVIIEFI